jgi:hypothetical protein
MPRASVWISRDSDTLDKKAPNAKADLVLYFGDHKNEVEVLSIRKKLHKKFPHLEIEVKQDIEPPPSNNDHIHSRANQPTRRGARLQANEQEPNTTIHPPLNDLQTPPPHLR